MSSPVAQPERCCRACGAKLSRYNPTPLCWSCQTERRSATETKTASPLPSLAPTYSSAFTLRSIVDTVRRTKPLRLTDVSQALKHFRNLHQLTQRDLAVLLGFDQSYISKLENGQHLRDLATLIHIATCLGIPLQWLGIPTEGASSVQSSELIEGPPLLFG
jgi:DNA-binding XRE family transcriptional regulator